MQNAKVKRFVKEGRGQGTGKDYIPWVKTSDYSSKGRATRIQGIKTQRIHHLHSDNQLRAFLIFEYSDAIIDIRESYPLLDLMEVIDDKEGLRLDKFTDADGYPLIICTTFVLTVRGEGGEERLVARSVKNTSELSKKITLEKLEIERRYWEARGVDWKVITEKQLSRQLCENIEWCRETLLQDMQEDGLANALLAYIQNNTFIPIKLLLNEFEYEEGLEPGKALWLFRYLLATKCLDVNIENAINLAATLEELK
ncbi:TnsA endonuclease N-terminal domain-containing protein [Lysinibacillus sp. FSL K6-0232]|uniref:TnsA endonuclease N-terminal domain-containing protein n=1 Tax=Lysinibacillus sp. FSL K6-0232 TaxID=2921425 RepID=UPI0030FC1C1D